MNIYGPKISMDHFQDILEDINEISGTINYNLSPYIVVPSNTDI